jgi:hypothetical protein
MAVAHVYCEDSKINHVIILRQIARNGLWINVILYFQFAIGTLMDDYLGKNSLKPICFCCIEYKHSFHLITQEVWCH